MVDQRNNNLIRMTLMAVMMLMVLPAEGVRLQDLVRLKGSESSKLVGWGIVVGLNGTGDNGKFKPAMRPVAAMLRKIIDPNVLEAELAQVKNVALVYVSVTVPSTGVREGDKLDVHVSALGAKSLKGGRLMLCPILPPVPGENVQPLAFAEGPLTLNDKENLNNGTIKMGASMVVDHYTQFMDENGYMTLVLDQYTASWGMSNLIATMINELKVPDGEPIAKAIDPKNIMIKMPDSAIRNPSSFISEILAIDFDTSLVRTEARVVINEKAGTIIWTGNVQISPVVISHKDLTITTITPERPATEEEPRLDTASNLTLDPQNRGGTNIKDLVSALNQLKVPTMDQISIVKELKTAGVLHAKLIINNQ